DSGLRVAKIGKFFRNIAREVNALRCWLVVMKLAFGSCVHWLGLLSMIRGLLTSDGGVAGKNEERFLATLEMTVGWA
ncbi:MAG: hypothetical protein WAN32_20855, partial [Candidatus Acidiferrum sp.]